MENYRVTVKGITENSVDVKPGFVFVARKGNKNDGTFYIEEAVRAGAVAIVIDRIEAARCSEEHSDHYRAGLQTFFIPCECRTCWQNPAERLTVIAVTGTNGKTTVSHFIGQLLNKTLVYELQSSGRRVFL